MYRVKRFSKNLVLNTNGETGFIKGRKYDTDLNRLSKSTSSLSKELSKNQLSSELDKMKKELKMG